MWRTTDSIPRDWIAVDWNVPAAFVSSMPYSLSHVLHFIFTVYADEHPFEFFSEEQRSDIMYGLLWQAANAAENAELAPIIRASLRDAADEDAALHTCETLFVATMRRMGLCVTDIKGFIYPSCCALV